MNSVNQIELVLKDRFIDEAGEKLRTEALRFFKVDTGRVKSAKVYTICYDLTAEQLKEFGRKALKDDIRHEMSVNQPFQNPFYQSAIAVAKLPGVTDDEGMSAQKTLADIFNLSVETQVQRIFTASLFYIEKDLPQARLKEIAEALLGNPLIHHLEYGLPKKGNAFVPVVNIKSQGLTEVIDIAVSDEQLIALSKKRVLSLNLTELKAIQAYYQSPRVKEQRNRLGMPDLPTDCEIEVIAQTWSEHCKHKEFQALIHYQDLDQGTERQIDSLFKTYIQGATEIIQDRLKQAKVDYLLKVFSDNAGVVRVDDSRVFIFKVETHNSPSALDPYGGALTGIVGVNRDPLGTGIGGAKLLFNTNVLCFGSPDYTGPLLPGMLHPRRVMAGVVKGIADGGNKSGLPTVNGAIIFDDRFRGKPLVFCGTGAIMPANYQGRNSWEKQIFEGDRIVMAGGRVGKDGIHGATFSSLEIDEYSPRSAVQIGSPITQKNLADFMIQACEQGLVRCSTDNGAGGLSSSVGELAQLVGGAVIQLEKVPLKYPGLLPWEIFVSESQERMTLVVAPAHIPELFRLAQTYEVELTDLGIFTTSGFLEVQYRAERVAALDLDFLHHGVPRKIMLAEWKRPKHTEPELNTINDYNEILLALTGHINICSREAVIRRYDHEVKGLSVIKPFMGRHGIAPQDAAVLRLSYDSYEGIAIANGIIPRYGDIDPYQMSAGAFDEAVRQIIAVGGLLPGLQPAKDLFWSVNDNFCLPDSEYHERHNSDGKYKLAKLVLMCEALFDMATFFNIPLISGKDSMKNDFVWQTEKISVPPTVLYSMVAKIADIRKTITSNFKKAGDLIFLIGQTYDELGGSIFYQLYDQVGANVPVVRKELARQIYLKMGAAAQAEILCSSHDLSDGGLAVALVECALDGEFGVEITLPDSDLSLNAMLFSESHSRFLVSIAPENRDGFEAIFGAEAQFLGTVSKDKRVAIEWQQKRIINIEVVRLQKAWQQGLKV